MFGSGDGGDNGDGNKSSDSCDSGDNGDSDYIGDGKSGDSLSCSKLRHSIEYRINSDDSGDKGVAITVLVEAVVIITMIMRTNCG